LILILITNILVGTSGIWWNDIVKKVSHAITNVITTSDFGTLDKLKPSDSYGSRWFYWWAWGTFEPCL